ncbi:MAG: 50S ribosomal protein L11 methyltransferase [Notoacmeibacter sp.]|nr:50S ribosomal protein L11 methyltransferase [Notoacmeibacter sp.]
MPQTRLIMTAGKAGAERIFATLEALLEEDGLPIAVVEIDEAADIHEVSVYVEGETGPFERRIREALEETFPGLEIATEPIPDVDWVAMSLEGLKPVRAGRFLVHGSHDRAAHRPGDMTIEIDAGQAFGTGHHGTTAGCLEMIEQVVRREHPANALDLGTGSAVLAIAMAKRARMPVVATDIDPVAVAVARANVRLNGVANQVQCFTATGFAHLALKRGRPFDLIVANILARPLMALAPQMARHVAAGGSAILSGILDSQRDQVIAAYRNQGFRHIRTLHREGWVTIHLKR